MDDGYFVLMMDMKGTLFEYEYLCILIEMMKSPSPPQSVYSVRTLLPFTAISEF